VEKLDRLAQALGRSAGIEIEEPTGRKDPERLWPRRRS
jgi:hypothetical protein